MFRQQTALPMVLGSYCDGFGADKVGWMRHFHAGDVHLTAHCIEASVRALQEVGKACCSCYDDATHFSRQGFPRADVDVAAVRADRQRVIGATMHHTCFQHGSAMSAL